MQPSPASEPRPPASERLMQLVAGALAIGLGGSYSSGNHLAGTHVMGRDKHSSVVDTHQRSWDHDNLYLVGGGSMPSIGTSNVTLTLAALCFRTSRAMLKHLG